jgi:hypothetical protein
MKDKSTPYKTSLLEHEKIHGKIHSKIYSIRGFQVMLDRDLAELYGVKTIRLREQVKRNISRFPSDFMFQLSKEETNLMVSQNAIPSIRHLGGTFLYVFTEQGVANISSILTSKRAIEVNIQIMRTFVAMRRFLYTNAQIFQRLDTLEIKQTEADQKINTVLNAIESKQIQVKQGIFYDGQIFDAYKFVSEIIRSANTSILVIDNYIDDSVLTLLSKEKKNIEITIITKSISKQLALDIKKHNEQYPEAHIKESKDFHDRFIIIDSKSYIILAHH